MIRIKCQRLLNTNICFLEVASTICHQSYKEQHSSSTASSKAYESFNINTPTFGTEHCNTHTSVYIVPLYIVSHCISTIPALYTGSNKWFPTSILVDTHERAKSTFCLRTSNTAMLFNDSAWDGSTAMETCTIIHARYSIKHWQTVTFLTLKAW